jgi:hypothetical protein
MIGPTEYSSHCKKGMPKSLSEGVSKALGG